MSEDWQCHGCLNHRNDCKCPPSYYGNGEKMNPSAGSACCIADSSSVAPKKTKHKRCWICGERLYGGKSYPREIDGHIRELHKFCSEQSKKEENISGVAFGMEY